MLRTTLLILCFGFAAACTDASQPAIGMEVRADDGTVLGHVTAIERDRDGRVIAAEIEGLEPADAPDAPAAVLAEDEAPYWVRTSASSGAGGDGLTALR